MEGIEEEVSRVKILTLNTYLLSMLMIDYLDELRYLPLWAKKLKKSGNDFSKELEQKVVQDMINHVYNQSPEDYRHMIKMFENLTKLLSTYNPEELEDIVDILDHFKNNKEEFMNHFNIVRDESKGS